MFKGKEFLSCRDVLWYLIFFGTAVNHMLKININLVIVATVMPKKTRVSVGQCMALENSTVWTNVTTVPNLSDITSSTTKPDEPDNSDKFAWSEYDQGLVLGAFFWLYWSTHVPGGVLGQRYGAKLVFGGGNMISAIINLLLPFAMKYHLIAVIFVRALQGFLMGTMFPSLYGIPGKWVPTNERNKFLTSNTGGSLGATLTYPLCAIIIHFFNWESAFYATSCIAFIWCILWWYCIYDSPQDHPRISKDELEYILNNMPPEESKKRKVPWASILTSMPVWITIFAHWGMYWSFITLLYQTPSYFSYIHGWNINMTGILSGAPHIVLFGFSYFYATFSDWLLKTNKMSRTVMRKITVVIGSGGSALMIIGLTFSGCKPILAVVFVVFGTALYGTTFSSTLANFVDLSPNYAGITYGIAGLIFNTAGFISPMIVGTLTNNNQTTEQWRIVFFIAAAILIVGCVTYIIWGTSKEQEWNNFDRNNTELGEEMQKLKVQSDLHTVDSCRKEMNNEKLPQDQCIIYESNNETKMNNS